MWLCTTFLTLLMCSFSSATLNGCELLVGGDLIYSDAVGNVHSGFMKYDISSSSFTPSANVYKDGTINSLVDVNNNLFFAGDFVRVHDEQSIGIGVYDEDSGALSGVSQGIWLESNSLPTSDTELSPALQLLPYSSGILVGGHFEYQNGVQQIALNGLALYSITDNMFEPFNQEGLFPSGAGSVISLTKDSTTGRLCAATMTSDSNHRTHVSCYNQNSWDELVTPSSSHTRILFDSLTLTNEETLFAISYNSDSGLLTDESIQFYLLQWDLNDLNAEPYSTFIYQKACDDSFNVMVYPVISKYTDDSVLIASPLLGCQGSSSIRFQTVQASNVYDIFDLTTISDAVVPKFLQVVDEDLFYFSNGTVVYRYESGHFTLIHGSPSMQVTALYYSVTTELLYISYNYGYEQMMISFKNGDTHVKEVFGGGLYSSGTVLTTVDMNDNQFMIGGDFKYFGTVEGGFHHAKLAAVWDGSNWKATLQNNANNYLPGWTLIAAASIGNTVFAIANPGGKDVADSLLPLIRWTENTSWQFLLQRPEIIDIDAWDNTVGAIYVDEQRDQIYFGGQFNVRLSSGETASGGVIYSYAEELWEALPGDLARVNAFGGQPDSPYLEIGGLFSYEDNEGQSHVNYALLDLNTTQLVNAAPSIPNSEIFAFSLFPDHSDYSFIGGDMDDDDAVKRLRYNNGGWSINSVGSPELEAAAFALTARNREPFLFAGGSFADGVSQLDISQSRWSSLLPDNPSWRGSARSLTLVCPTDVDVYSYAYDEDTSRVASLYSVESCTIPLGAPDDYVCPETMSIGVMFGLLFTVFITITIVAVIGFFGYKKWKKDKVNPIDTVEFL